ncbi:hypothetical protein CW736_09490 [Nonlabens sp. MB-3u-79]|nr:hypothetical protein CW736_09490 [Nonlabens sp. MB-3u-79]
MRFLSEFDLDLEKADFSPLNKKKAVRRQNRFPEAEFIPPAAINIVSVIVEILGHHLTHKLFYIKPFHLQIALYF